MRGKYTILLWTSDRYNKTLFLFGMKTLQSMGFTVMDIWKCEWEELESTDLSAKTAAEMLECNPRLNSREGVYGEEHPFFNSLPEQTQKLVSTSIMGISSTHRP